MENMELLQAMRQMMEEVVSPIYERMDRMEAEFTSLREEVSSVKEEVASVKEEVSSVKVLATKTQITLENDIKPKINLLFEGHITLQNRFSQLDRMEEMLRGLRYDVQDLQHIVSWHSSDIRWLKRRRYSNKI